ncbi:MAG: peptidyl-prolyl cis-trans isomerase [Polyangiales bacterium]
MVRLRSWVFATWLLVGCNGCDRGNAPRRPDGAARDASVAAASDGGPRREDPCDILEPAQRGLVVARVGDQTLTLCDFAKRINSQNPYLRARFTAPEQRRALLQSWLDSELLAAEARERHLDDAPEVRRSVTMQLARQLEREVRNGVPQPEVSDAEVRAYFDAHRSEYETEPQVRASQIALASRAEADALLAELRAHPDDDGLFRERARRLSTDAASRAADGDMGFFGRAGGAGVEPEVASAAFALTRTGSTRRWSRAPTAAPTTRRAFTSCGSPRGATRFTGRSKTRRGASGGGSSERSATPRRRPPCGPWSSGSAGLRMCRSTRPPSRA